ncbi:MAG: kelch repeat-containing protein, partial [Anaerolineae bacterium]
LYTGRSEHTATALLDGRILVAGGQGPGTGYNDLSSAELYDPAPGLWTATGSLQAARREHTATRLPDGRVLVAGGLVSEAGYLSSAELYDPDTGQWTATGGPVQGRYAHTATLLPDGRVLVAGGWGDGYLASAELYDPVTGLWTTTGNLNAARMEHTATPLPGGWVLVAGGSDAWGALVSSEAYNLETGSWTAFSDMSTARTSHTATPLPDGRVLVIGGFGASDYVDSAEVYVPVTGEWAAAGTLTAARYSHTATLLPSGRVIAAGGYNYDAGGVLASAELYDPATGEWALSGDLSTGRRDHTATLLPGGRVLVAGGDGASGVLASADLYAPVWTATGTEDGNQFGISVAGAGDTNRDGHDDLVIGAPGMQSRAHLYYGDTGLSPAQLTVPDRDVQTLVVSHIDGSPDPLAFLQVRDATSEEVYGVVTSTLYVVDQAITGTWTVNLYGDTEGANLAVSAVAAPNPPILDQLTVDASDLANTLVTYRLLSDYQPVTMHMFANDGPLTETTTITLPLSIEGAPEITRTEVVTLYQGIEVATIPISGTLAVKNALITTTLDLSFLESGDYKLWVRVEDGVSPPVQGYVWGVDTYTSGDLPTSWNRVRIAAEDYDAGRQLAGAALITVDHSDTWADAWATTMSTEIISAGLHVEFTPYDHPDVDGYALELTGLGETRVITTGQTLTFDQYDENGVPIGDPLQYVTFKGLSPQQTYSIRIAALDLDSGRSAWSQVQTFTVPVGALALRALEPAITLPAGEELVTATLILTMSEELFSDVHLSLESYQLPPGIALKGITYEPFGSAGTTASLLPWEGIPAPARLAPSLVALSAEGATNASTTLLARAALTVTQDVPAGAYLLPFVAYSGLLEKRAEVRLLVGAPQEVLVPAGATEPVVLDANLPLPSCATAIRVTIPPGAFSTAAYVGFLQGSFNVEDWAGMRFAGSHFNLSARDEGGGALQPLAPLTLNLGYDPLCLGELREESLNLRSWQDQSGWLTGGIACTPDPPGNRLVCSLSEVADFALFGPATSYLPLVMKES